MNPKEQNRWKNELLELVLVAFAIHAPLRNMLVFKGARILNLLLGETLRESLDIDSNLDLGFTAVHSELVDQKEYLRRETERALSLFFSRQEPVRYALRSVSVEMKPEGGHPFGWTGFIIRISVQDNKRPNVIKPPVVELDVASPEELCSSSIADLKVDDHSIRAYTIERIAGEKMRAFLSSLPAYIRKIGRRTDNRRVKDVYDLARIRRHYDFKLGNFWKDVGNEFKTACRSRFIDCEGISTFSEDIEITRNNYDNDPTLPKDIDFDEAWKSLENAVEIFENIGIVPFRFPLPKKIVRD